MNLEIKGNKSIWPTKDQMGGLTTARAQKGVKMIGIGAWECSRDLNSMWDMTTNCIRKVVREVLGSWRETLVDIEGIGGGMKRSKEKWKSRRLFIWCWLKAKTRRKWRQTGRGIRWQKKEVKLTVSTAN